MLWQNFKQGFYIETNYPYKKDMSSLMLINIDCGLAWNPYGKKYSLPEKEIGWVWANSAIPDYINSLYKEKYIPVLFSEFNSKETIIQISSYLKYQPLIIIGLTINEVQQLSIKIYENISSKLKLKDYDIVSIPKMDDDIEGLDLNDLGISAKDNYPDPAIFKIGILIGQQGSGKSNYSNFLEENGYYIIREKEAEKIRNRRTQKAIKEFKEQIQKVLNHKYKGIIIDATNATIASREVYNEIANDMKIEVVNLWLSKSGFDYNSKRTQPVPKIALYTYAKNLQLPEKYIRVL